MISSLLNRYYLMRAYGSFRKLFRCRLRSLFRPDALPELVLCFVNSVSNRESYPIGQAESRRDPFTRLPASALLDSARQCCISGRSEERRVGKEGRASRARDQGND